MSQSSEGRVGFQSKFLLSWLVVGAVFWVILLITESFTDLSTAQSKPVSFPQFLQVFFGGLIFSAIVSVLYGGLGFLLDGMFRHNFKYGEIKYAPWQWHIYPITATLAIVIGILGFAMHLESKLRR